ncbi:unnamed protein product [Caenorhabditis nigoni]
MIIHAVIALLSLMLIVKVFIWNKCSNVAENKDLTRANRLALIDISIIFVFDVIPPIILTKFPAVGFDDIGPIFSFTKMSGYSLEGYLVMRTLKWKQATKNANSISVIQLGTIRCWLVFSIGLDRVLATCTPIFYHNNRSKFPLSGVFLFIVAYALLENYILFVHCDFEIDIPLDCNTFRCAIETCYHNYWKWYQQIMYVLIGTLSIILFFRLFIWNNCKKGAKNKAISRATWISLLDSFIIFAFDFFPVFLTAQWPDINTKTVGPLGSLCKQLGLVIESFVVCNVLLNKKVVPITRSQTSPTNFPVVY